MKFPSIRLARSSAPFAIVVAAAFAVSPAFAENYTWLPASGDFMDGLNWSGGIVPGAADRGVISNSGTATISSGSASMVEIWVGQNLSGTQTGTLVQTGGDITLSDGLVVGRQDDAVGTYTMTGGTLSLVNFRVGGGPIGPTSQGTSQGTMTVSGAGTAIISTGAGVTGVGVAGTGTLTLADSAVFTHNSTTAFLVGADNATAGANGGTGTVNVNSGAQLNIATGNLAIGRNNFGNGTVNVNGGSITLSGASAQINLGVFNGVSAAGTGMLTINSGSVTGSIVRIMEGAGTVNLNGGALTTGSMFRGAANASAAVNFNGGTLRASADSGDFFNGFSNSHLNIQAGGLTFDTNGHAVNLTQGFSGVGVLTKTGAGTLLINGASTHAGGTLINGGMLIVAAGDLGTGAITVASGGTLDFDYDFTLTTAGLVLETGSQFMLDQDLTFAGLTIAGDDFVEGVYSYATLEAQYGSIFLDGGSGQITVVPEPSTLALIGIGATVALWRIRRRS